MSETNRLYVGGFTREIEKQELIAVFKPYGVVKDVWLAYNPPGYGFIEFTSDEGAKAAMDALNGCEVLDSVLQIQFSRKRGAKSDGKSETSTAATSPTAKISITDIASKVSIGAVNSAFEEFGTLVDIAIAKDGLSVSLEYEEVACAMQAAEQTNGTELFGGTVQVDVVMERAKWVAPAERRGEKRGADTPSSDSPCPDGSRCFIGGFKRKVEKEELMEEFQKFGSVNDIWIAFNPPGFSFITFDDPATAQAAVDEMNGKEVFGGRLKVEITKSRKKTASEMEAKNDPTKKPRVWVGNISEEIEKDAVSEVFSQYGSLKDVFVQKSRGFAFVEFETMTEATDAISALNGTHQWGGPIKCALTTGRKTGDGYEKEKGGYGGRGGYQAAPRSRPPAYRGAYRGHAPYAAAAPRAPRPAYYDEYAAPDPYAASDPYTHATPDPYYDEYATADAYYTPGPAPRARPYGARPPPRAARPPPATAYAAEDPYYGGYY